MNNEYRFNNVVNYFFNLGTNTRGHFKGRSTYFSGSWSVCSGHGCAEQEWVCVVVLNFVDYLLGEIACLLCCNGLVAYKYNEVE
jgi:hypothetical protein